MPMTPRACRRWLRTCWQGPHSREMPRVAKGNLAAAFIFAWEGIAYVVHTQRNMRIHLGVATVVLLAAGALRVSRIELAILLLCIMAVTALEMLNTVVEAAVDLATEE